MELRITNPQENWLTEQILWNNEELKAAIAEKVKDYKTIAYTEDSLKDMKADRADLNKLKKAFEDERKRVKKICMEPYTKFEQQVKEITALIDEPIGLIDSQIKEIDESRKAVKREEIEELFLTVGFQSFVKLDMIWDEKWLNEILIPKLSMQGLADYSKSTGYVAGDVTLDYETKKCAYDRGRMFNVDAMDNIESAGIAFGRLSGEFLRTQVVPELDAYRLASYAQISGVTTAKAVLATGKEALAALRTARGKIENAEANLSTCYLFINPTVYGMIEDLDTTASKKAIEGFAGIIKVPSGRFYDKVKLNASGAGGFTKDTGAVAMNFLIVDKQAAIQYQKHTVSKVISPDQNQTADGWKFGYRTVGIAECKDNKKDGIYVHTAAAE